MLGLKKRAEDRKLENDLYLSRRGYDYAAGRLLRGGNVKNLYEEAARCDDHREPFTIGVCDAVRDWEKKGKVG